MRPSSMAARCHSASARLAAANCRPATPLILFIISHLLPVISKHPKERGRKLYHAYRNSNGRLEKPRKYFLAHIAGDKVPIILFNNHRARRRNNCAHFLRMLHDVLYLRSYLLRRIRIHRKAGYWLVGIPFLVEKKIRDAAFLGCNDRKPRGHRLDERIAHTLRARRAYEDVARFEILRHFFVPYLSEEQGSSFELRASSLFFQLRFQRACTKNDKAHVLR